MRSSKSRSRSKANRPRPLGNIVNRVFDSSGPEGKVRGTPQQIIDKYLVLARDAQLGNDRVAAENFLQHAEHYTRMLNEAQREMTREAEARRVSQSGGEQRQRPDDREARRDDGRGDDNGRDEPRRDDARRDEDQRDESPREAPAASQPMGGADKPSDLFETPESGDSDPRPRRGRARRAPAAGDDPQTQGDTAAPRPEATDRAAAGETPEAPSAKPAPRRRAPRKPRATPSDGADAEAKSSVGD